MIHFNYLLPTVFKLNLNNFYFNITHIIIIYKYSTTVYYLIINSLLKSCS